MKAEAQSAARDATLDELLQSLQPRGALAEYYVLAGSSGLFPQLASVVAGLRPGMDCWIPFRNLEAFRRFVAQQKLSLAIDCAFRRLPSDGAEKIVGMETLCTTHALGILVEDAKETDGVHLFVGASPEMCEKMRACGWYPVVVNCRAHHKPVIDHLEFGRALGYPSCCIDFFAKSNNWVRTNSYAEACHNTRTRFDFRTNCMGKNSGYSLNFHMPCGFDCAATIGFGEQLLEFLDRSEPEYAASCRKLLLKPILSLNEREVVVLDGVVDQPGRIQYRSAVNLFSTPDSTMNAIRQGNILEIRGRFVVVLRNSELVEVLECRCDEFGPQVPLLVSWTSA